MSFIRVFFLARLLTILPTSPYDDPKSFAKLSEIFEGVGAAAYLGSASLVQNKTLLTASGAILATEYVRLFVHLEHS